jgi:hypothetical protein
MRTIDELVVRMEELLAELDGRGDENRHFLATYLRTTEAVREDLALGGFVDPQWAERWDVAFAELYLEPLARWRSGQAVPTPWAIAFEAGADPAIPPLRHVLLGMNAHVNFDLARSLLAVITVEEFDQPHLVARRAADHEHVDRILVSRVAAEDHELRAVEDRGDRTLVDRMLTPFNRSGTKRFLKEARAKVWRNARELNLARRRGEDAYRLRVAELERLSAERVADLRRPGQVLLRLARRGFGVVLPPQG